ncbi:MAG: hypothetical protein J0G98_16425 [Terrimonas ferruginea]|jgi:hypothetical protein|uniref:hypothetical protein n=1 Tax=Terrimonas ferruginea TaxID=249 RepID=UPI00092BC50C|nr:hypothetical protein [Terrimonas ferruginea]MBN8784645.1 hypothetical protein [Terrimonas ferruginea]OJW39590.1 MAG: hypothetical protein BGO56_01860 [Sphingobacteriales bacterium 48-107]
MKIIFVLFSATLLFSSCGTQRKIESARKTVNTFQDIRQRELQGLDSLNSIVVSKSNVRGIDGNTRTSLNSSLGKLRAAIDSASRNATVISEATQNKRDFKKRYNDEIRPRVIELDTFNSRYGRRVHVYAMLNDVVNISNYNLFNLAAFFDPGVYRIPANSYEKVKALFGPVIDTLASFSNKYKDVSHTASIVLQGFADATMVADSSDLYTTLAQMLHMENPGRQDLNRQLSQLRANELLRQLKFLIMQKAPNFSNFNRLRITYLAVGQGEEYPLPYITDYRDDDERRRIVLCYWSVLPEF